MRCGLPAEDCATLHWSPPLDGRRERAGWRAPCPVCHQDRALEYSLNGHSIRWNSFCGHHDKDAVRPVLRKLLGDCLPGRHAGPGPVDRGELIALALTRMPGQSKDLALLELAGMGTREALDKLGIPRQSRPRVIAGRVAAVRQIRRS